MNGHAEIASVTRAWKSAESECAKLRVQLAAEQDISVDLVEQLRLRSESQMAKDLQEIMKAHNETIAELAAERLAHTETVEAHNEMMRARTSAENDRRVLIELIDDIASVCLFSTPIQDRINDALNKWRGER